MYFVHVTHVVLKSHTYNLLKNMLLLPWILRLIIDIGQSVPIPSFSQSRTKNAGLVTLET